MAVFSGFYALGTHVDHRGVFVEATGYTRPAANMSGTALSGLNQSLGQITGPTGPTGGALLKGALFDALTGGNCLCYWDWSIRTTVPSNFAAIAVNMSFNDYLRAALSLSAVGGPSSSGAAMDRGAQIGLVNGNPLVAGSILSIQSGSLLVPTSGGSGGSTNVIITSLVPLDVATVTTGGTPVTALLAGHRTAGGWIQNPPTATTTLGINEIGTAAGTTSSGNTTFIEPGETYKLAANPNTVSVISSDSAHAFSGMGFQ